MLITCLKRAFLLCCLIVYTVGPVSAENRESIFSNNHECKKNVSSADLGGSFLGQNSSVFSVNNKSGDKIIFPGIDDLNMSDIPVGESALVLFLLVVYFNLFYQRKKASSHDSESTSRKYYYD